jgi:hypothetical protein
VSYSPPTIGDFKAQLIRDFPYATPLFPNGVTNATLTASVNDSGNVTAVAVTSGGAGYSATTPPSAVIYGGGGIGALATPVLTGGSISSVVVNNAGIGYSQAPLVYVAVGDNTDTEKVTDYDIARAMLAALQFNFNSGLFSSQASYTYAANLLSAHYLCETVVAGTTGLNGKAEWLTRAKAVGNVSEDFDIPKRILNSPYLSKLSKTTYGAQFLELVSPQLIANFQTFYRQTLP